VVCYKGRCADRLGHSFRIVLIAFAIWSGSLRAAGDSAAWLEVTLNKQVQGEFQVVIESGGQVWVLENDWSAWRLAWPIDARSRVIEGQRYLRVPCSELRIRCSLDVAHARLDLQLDPSLFTPTQRDLRPGQRVQPIAGTSGYFNYAINYSESPSGPDAISLPLEVGWRRGEWLLESQWMAMDAGGERNWSRLFTRISREMPASRAQWTLGDFYADSGSQLYGVGALAGLRYASDYGVDPYFRRQPGLRLTGMLTVPAEVEVLVDGVRVSRTELPAGAFDLTQITMNQGVTDATVVIRDAFGNVSRQRTVTYVPLQALAEDISEFGYAIGARREAFGVAGANYGDWVVSAYHRHGLSDTVTIGAHAMYETHRVIAGLDGNVVLGNAGELQWDVTTLRDQGRHDVAAGLGYRYSGRRTFASLYAQVFQGFDFFNQEDETSDARTRYQGALSVGIQDVMGGSLTLGYRQFDSSRGAQRSGATSIQYSRTLGRNLTLSASFTHQRQGAGDGLFLSLYWYPEAGVTANFVHRQNEDRRETMATVQNTPSRFRDLGWRASATHSSDLPEPISEEAEVDYYGPYGEYRAAWRHVGGTNALRVSLNGGLVFIDGGVHPTPAIRSGFALVDVGQPDIEVRVNNNPVATTGRSGKAVVTRLSPYAANLVSIDTSDLPLHMRPLEIDTRVAPYRKGGVATRLRVVSMPPVYGVLVLDDSAEPGAVEFARLEIFNAETTADYLVGLKGAFYIEELEPGHYGARAEWPGGACSFQLDVPESPLGYTDLGEVICHAE